MRSETLHIATAVYAVDKERNWLPPISPALRCSAFLTSRPARQPAPATPKHKPVPALRYGRNTLESSRHLLSPGRNWLPRRSPLSAPGFSILPHAQAPL